MKLSLWHKGHYVTIEGSKDEIMSFLDGLDRVEITSPNETYSPPTYWGGYMEPNTGGSIDITGSDLMNSSNAWFQNDNVEFKK